MGTSEGRDRYGEISAVLEARRDITLRVVGDEGATEADESEMEDGGAEGIADRRGSECGLMPLDCVGIT